jgi:nanoRNase/pAp phosphatase (c-di-AMP/oligoRNAs hydrolase)
MKMVQGMVKLLERYGTGNDVNTRSEKPLIRMLNAHRNERHMIVLQDYPDPDAISSAFTHQLMSLNFGIVADIVYSGSISHHENQALVRLLGIDLIRFDPSMDLEEYDGAVFIDHQGTTSPVDHHTHQDRVEPSFTDIRNTGAAASIYASYIEDGLLELDPHNKNHVRAATALMHGIMTDTVGFLQAKVEDYYAAAVLSPYVDTQLLQEILNQSLSKQTLEVIQKAIENRLIVEGFSIAPTGLLREADRDAIPQAADFLLGEENVHTAIVYGIVSDEGQEEKLVGSLRTLKISLDVDDFLKSTLGEDSMGEYYGGGKESAGGFAIPIGFLSGGHDEEIEDLKWKLFDLRVKNKFLEKIS